MNEQEKNPSEAADTSEPATEPQPDQVPEKDLDKVVGGLRYHKDVTTGLPIKEL